MVKKRDRQRTTPRLRKPPKELTARQEAFVREYLVDINGAQAAVRAGGGSRRAARTAAWRLLTKSEYVLVVLATGHSESREKGRVVRHAHAGHAGAPDGHCLRGCQRALRASDGVVEALRRRS